MGAYKGWNKEFQKYLLQPVDKNDNEWFYPVTSLTQYEPDKDSIMVYSETAGMAFDLSKGVSLGESKPEIDEFNWGAKEPSVQIQFSGSGTGYQAMPFSVDQAFNPKK